MPPILVLVGPPGAGKTTVGAAVSHELGVGFRDTDADIETATGRPVGEIVVADGEAEFRRQESAAVRQALTESDGVVALGSGAVADRQTRDLLAGRFVVNLSVGATEAAKRAGIGGPRPLSLGNVRTTWARLMAARQPLYQEVATITVATDGSTPSGVAREIVAHLGQVAR